MPSVRASPTAAPRAPGPPRADAASPKVGVMHVVEAFCGGVFSSVRQIVNHLDAARFEVTLVYSLRPETPSDLARKFAPHVRLLALPMQREIRPGADIHAAVNLRRLLQQRPPQVLHLHSSKAGMLGRLAAHRLPTAVIYSPRGWSFLRQDVGGLRRRLFHGLEQLGDRLGGTVVACSPGEYQASRAFVRDLRLIPNAIDVAELDALTELERAAEPPAPLVIAICARVTPARAPALFADVARAVTARCGAAVRFQWIGAGDPPADLARSGVNVTGWMSRADAVRTLARAAIYLHTSLWEGMPLAILEAMALGKPVVATDVIGNRDILLHGRTGFLEATAPALVDRLLQLIRDPELRLRMGQLGRERVRADFNLPGMITAWQNLYQELAQSRPAAPRRARSASA